MVVMVLLFSLLESFFILPAHLNEAQGSPGPWRRFLSRFGRTRRFHDAVAESLDRRRDELAGREEGLAARDGELAARAYAARTFAEGEPDEVFWYENANGLVELAINQGNLAGRLGLVWGTRVAMG